MLYGKEILEDALDLINNDRSEVYGDPTETARKIGMAWSAVLGLGEPIPPFKVHLMMAAMKAVRAAGAPTHCDSFIDGAAYFALSQEAVVLP